MDWLCWDEFFDSAVCQSRVSIQGTELDSLAIATVLTYASRDTEIRCSNDVVAFRVCDGKSCRRAGLALNAALPTAPKFDNRPEIFTRGFAAPQLADKVSTYPPLRYGILHWSAIIGRSGVEVRFTSINVHKHEKSSSGIVHAMLNLSSSNNKGQGHSYTLPILLVPSTPYRQSITAYFLC